jgi:large subunit ribosomal protein L28
MSPHFEIHRIPSIEGETEDTHMGKVCELCGKHTTFGNTISRRGMAKYLGGVGVKKTGVSRRQFQPNVQKIRVEMNGETRRAKICSRCIKTGQFVKARKRDIPEAVRAEMKARAEARRPEARRAARRARIQARNQAAKAKAAPKPKKP